jgi:hypothetical protein
MSVNPYDPDDMAQYPDACPVCSRPWQHDKEDPGTCATCGHDPNAPRNSSLMRNLASLEREIRSWAISVGEKHAAAMERTTLKGWAQSLLALRRQAQQEVLDALGEAF